MKATAGEGDHVLTTGQAAALLGVHPNTIRRWTRERLLNAYRLGARGDRRFAPGEIQRFLETYGAAPTVDSTGGNT